MRRYGLHSLLLLAGAGFTSLLPQSWLVAQERIWQDPSGLFKVEASLVTKDDKLVVLKQSDGELVVVKRAQLSKPDQDFLNGKTDKPEVKEESAPLSPVDEPSDPSSASPLPSSEDGSTFTTSAVTNIPTSISKWRLRNGDVIEGKLVGFAVQDYQLRRLKGEIIINNVRLKELPAAYALVLPAVVANIDSIPLANIDELEKHLAKGGGGPFEYVVRGVQLMLEGESALTVPIDFLAEDVAELVEPGFQRWLAARAEQVSEEDRYDTDSRERLLLQSYSRLENPALGEARRFRQLELGLLNVNAGVTELWEVSLIPNTPFGYARSVVVAGRDSGTAVQIALDQFPGWQLGYVKKVSD